MSEELPAPIVEFIQAKQDRNTQALLRTLEKGACIVDTRGRYVGHDAITTWIEHVDRIYDGTYEVSRLSKDDTSVKIYVDFRNTVSGEEHTLVYTFTLHENKILSVEIGK